MSIFINLNLKVLASAFWVAHLIIFVKYLEKGKMINNRITEMFEGGHSRRMITYELKRRKLSFHQEGASCYKFVAKVARIHDLHFLFIVFFKCTGEPTFGFLQNVNVPEMNI